MLWSKASTTLKPAVFDVASCDPTQRRPPKLADITTRRVKHDRKKRTCWVGTECFPRDELGRLTSNVSQPARTFESMPRISSFYGISILMFFGDHNPPHFHARYAGQVARVALDGSIIDGRLPRRAARLVSEWATLHGDELSICWDRAVDHELPGTIDPLL